MSSKYQFRPASSSTWEINQVERSRQVSWLVPLLERPDGQVWLIKHLQCPCPTDEAEAAEPFHLCFPLRDKLTEEYRHCRGKPDLEDQFIAYYNNLFDLPEDFGIQEVWKAAPGGEIRHPTPGGRRPVRLVRKVPPETSHRSAPLQTGSEYAPNVRH